ncbi:MAG TPA: hypothetical protein VFI74_05635 [Candidatus Saccharimonadales bacterium]|nr:hypothetical protein [Candidatus Saccharimonadales bacterium]
MWILKNQRRTFLLIFGLFLVAHLFIFRGIVAQIPDILSGHAVLVREELVPFFNAHQYWPDDTSALTGSDEIRVAYSFWSSWVRYYAVLPFAIVILNAISAFILFYAFYRIGKMYAGKSRNAVILAALLATIPIHFILLYAKITHFYTLILGFSMLALSLTYVIEQLFFHAKFSWRNAIIASMLALANPAIHYHVIFYTVLAIIVTIHVVTAGITRHISFMTQLKKDIAYAAIVTALSLIPYALFILLATSATSAAQNIPVNYYMIFHTSVPFGSLFAFDIAAQVDMFRYGNYLLLVPRYFMMILGLVIAGLFITGKWRITSVKNKTFLLGMLALMVVSAWMSIGYSNTFSFHSLLAHIAVSLSYMDTTLTDKVTQLMGVFINILRFPHRFEFTYFYAGGVLLTITLLRVYDWLRSKKHLSWPVASLLLSVLVIVPILLTQDYRQVLLSGNFDNFLKVYSINSDLKEIRSILAKDKTGSMMILPTMESGKEIIGQSGTERFNFIDKFFIFYLNKPTVYYGSGADSEQKIKAFQVYRSIYDGNAWWQDSVIDNMGVKYVLEPKNIKDRPIGITYMPDIEKKIDSALRHSDRFEQVYDGPNYALYRAKPTAAKNPETLVDMRWKSLEAYLSKRESHKKLYYPVQKASLPQQFVLKTDSSERSFYDLYTAKDDRSIFKPDYQLLPFMDNITPGSNYLENPLSIFALNAANGVNNSLEERVPSLVNLGGTQFVATGRDGGVVRIGFRATDNSGQRLLLRAASRSDDLTVHIDGRKVAFHKIADDKAHNEKDSIDFTYFVADTKLAKGKHTATIDGVKNTVVVEDLSVLKTSDIPKQFDDVTLPGLTIHPNKDGQYTVHLKKNQ